MALAPKADLIRIAYAHALIESANRHNEPKKLEKGDWAIRYCPPQGERNQHAFIVLLATAYGRLGDEVERPLKPGRRSRITATHTGCQTFCRICNARTAVKAATSQNIRARDILKYVEEIEKDS